MQRLCCEHCSPAVPAGQRQVVASLAGLGQAPSHTIARKGGPHQMSCPRPGGTAGTGQGRQPGSSPDHAPVSRVRWRPRNKMAVLGAEPRPRSMRLPFCPPSISPFAALPTRHRLPPSGAQRCAHLSSQPERLVSKQPEHVLRPARVGGCVDSLKREVWVPRAWGPSPQHRLRSSSAAAGGREASDQAGMFPGYRRRWPYGAGPLGSPEEVRGPSLWRSVAQLG